MDKKENVIVNNDDYTSTIHEWSPIDESGRHKSSMEIEKDIEETRHSMDLILDTLNGKASPGSLYNKIHHYFQKTENREKARKTLSTVSNSISNSFQRNPLPVMMIAAGASWMFWELNQPSHDGKTGENLQRFKGETAENFEAAKEGTAQKADEVKQRTAEKIGAAKEKAESMSSEAQRKSGSFIDQARNRGEDYRQKTSDFQNRAKHSYHRADTSVHANPLLFGVAAACAGIVAGLLLPETRTDDMYIENNPPETR
ncbi:MAG TPA: hypothetical protein VHP36_01525 [Chitinispirillaceae bacterium]|nr:hypothetical protein [Chitinispirillaceae bacterium]